MNWFQRFFTNPNVHAIASALSNSLQPVAIATGHPEVAIAVAALGTLTGLVSAGTPENPVAVPMPANVTIPIATATGSPHVADYINASLAALGSPAVALPRTGSLHKGDYLQIIATLTQAMQGAPDAPVKQ